METVLSTKESALGPSITLFPSGRQFFYSSPTWNIEDIAHALGMACRFAGNVRHFYSVAEHSVVVSLLMEELGLGDPLEGLLHDAHESVSGDLVVPAKAVVAGWHPFELELERSVRDHFHLPMAKTFGCAQADKLALYIEAWFLKANRGALGSRPDGAEREEDVELRSIARDLIDKQGWRTLNLLPQEATAAFLDQWNSLRA